MNVQTVMNTFSNGFFLLTIGGIVTYGHYRHVQVYESFIEGAKEGFDTVIRIVPYLVAMLVAIGMLRASGAFELLTNLLSAPLAWVGLPADIFPMTLMRPFSGGATNGLLADVVQTHGGDDYVSRLAATIVGSTDTTFYILALYLGAASIKNSRHVVPAALVADVVGVIVAILICRLVFL